MAIRAPFQISETPAYQSGLVLHKNVWKTPNQIVTESNSLQEERIVTEQFPVSSGVEHQQKENTYGAAEASQEINVFAQFQVRQEDLRQCTDYCVKSASCTLAVYMCMS